MRAAQPAQPSLFDRSDSLREDEPRSPAIDADALARAQRTWLDATAWVEHLPGWVRGERALMDALVRETRWRQERRHMYNRIVDVPRLRGRPAETTAPATRCSSSMGALLSAH